MLTNDDRLAEEVRLLRNHGERLAGRPLRARPDRLNSRLDTLQAAILLVKLEALDEEIACRSALSVRYAAALGDLVEVPAPLVGGRSAWAQYTIRVAGRDRLAAALGRRGIRLRSTIRGRCTGSRPTRTSRPRRAVCRSPRVWPGACSACRSIRISTRPIRPGSSPRFAN